MIELAHNILLITYLNRQKKGFSMTTKFYGDKPLTVTPKSKNTTWEYKGTSASYLFSVNPDVTSSAGYDENYKTFAVKQKNNLVITTVFTTVAGKVKKVTNTIKNFFADKTKTDYTVKYKSWFTVNGTFSPTITPSTPEGKSGLFGAKSGSMYLLASTAKNAPELVLSTSTSLVYDTKGNDKYRSAHSNYDYVYDMAGKDEYSATFNKGVLYTYDYKGSDKYNVGNNAELHTFDYAGNDKYSLEDSLYTKIDDRAGKDTYNIMDYNDHSYNNEGSPDFSVSDKKGNDTYNIIAIDFDYNSISDGVYAISDLAGNDKYNFSGTKDYNAVIDDLCIYDKKGDDKYTMTVNSSDDGIGYTYIYDDAGSDTYTLKGAWYNSIFYVKIYDKSKSKDKYNFNKVNNFYIADQGGNDTYKITNSYGSIWDEGGNDKYTINPSSKESTYYLEYIYANDSGKGKDSYNVNISNRHGGGVSITDDGGKDSLILSGFGKGDISNLVFMTDINYEGECTDKGSLIIYNTMNESFVRINNFYNVNSSGDIIGFGDGKIETIKVGNTVLKTTQSQALYNDFNNLKANIAGWLEDNEYSSVDQALISTSSDGRNAREGLARIFAHQGSIVR